MYYDGKAPFQKFGEEPGVDKTEPKASYLYSFLKEIEKMQRPGFRYSVHKQLVDAKDELTKHAEEARIMLANRGGYCTRPDLK